MSCRELQRWKIFKIAKASCFVPFFFSSNGETKFPQFEQLLFIHLKLHTQSFHSFPKCVLQHPVFHYKVETQTLHLCYFAHVKDSIHCRPCNEIRLDVFFN